MVKLVKLLFSLILVINLLIVHTTTAGVLNKAIDLKTVSISKKISLITKRYITKPMIIPVSKSFNEFEKVKHKNILLVRIHRIR